MKNKIFALVITTLLTGCAGVFHFDEQGRHGPYVLACEVLGDDYAVDYGVERGAIITEVCKQGAGKWAHELPPFIRKVQKEFGNKVSKEDLKMAASYWQMHK